MGALLTFAAWMAGLLVAVVVVLGAVIIGLAIMDGIRRVIRPCPECDGRGRVWDLADPWHGTVDCLPCHGHGWRRHGRRAA